MPKNTFIRARNVTGDVWAGRRLGTRSAAHGIVVRDDQGNEVLPAAELLITGGGRVSEPEDNVAEINVGGSATGGHAGAGIIEMLNNSGDDLLIYAVVVVDETADNAVTTTTTAQDTRIVGVLQEDIAAGETGLVLFNGWTPGVITTAAVARGDYLETSTTAGQATTNPTRREGSFAVLTTGGDPAAVTPSGVLDHLIDSATTEYSNGGAGGTGLTVTMPTTVPIGMVLVLVVQVAAGSAVSTPTGWTRIGSTAGFYVYRRISDGTEGATLAVTWTTTSVAVAHVLVLDGLDLVTPVEGSAFDDTTAAASIAGLVSDYQLAIAYTRAAATGQAGWEDVASGSATGGGGGGGTVDLNNVHGTASSDPNNTAGFAAMTNPSNVNDANDGTFGDISATVAGAGRRGALTDLGASYPVASIRLKSLDNHNSADEFYYSNDGSSWSGGASTGGSMPGTWSGATTDEVFTLTTPITARYWRYDRAHGGGFAAEMQLDSWELRGVDSLADVDSTVVMKLNAGTPATSPFTGATNAHDAIVALALTAAPFLVATTPSALLYGDDLTGTGGGSSGDLYVNVMDPTYGAVGDGVADDTVAIQAAIDATPAFATCFFPAGTYKITASLVVAANIRLLGVGGYLAAGATPSASAIVMTTNNTTAISQTNHPGYLTIEGIHIVNTGAQASGKGINALGSVILSHVYIDGFYDGIYVDALTGDPYNVFINETDVHDCTRAGLYLAGKVNNFHTDGFNAFSCQHGIYASGGFLGGSIEHGDFEGNSATGITIDGIASGQTADSLLISQCYFEQDSGSPTANISLGPATLVQGVVLEQCIFVLGPASLVHLRANHVDGLTVIGCHFWHGSDSGSISCDAANTTNVTLIGVKADGSVTTPATTRILDETDVAPVAVDTANAVGTSKYLARATHVHQGAPYGADYLVGTAQAGLSSEIVVGAAPGGELGGTWASPTVDATHSGSSHAATEAAAEATAAAALAAALAALNTVDHEHIGNLWYSGDGVTTAFELPAAPFDESSVAAYVAGVRLAVTLSGTMLTTMTFGSAPASGTDNIVVDLVAAAA